MNSQVTKKVLFGFAVVLFAIAVYFGNLTAFDRVTLVSGASCSTAIASNTMAGLTSFGFSLAGGLALMAAALVRKDG